MMSPETTWVCVGLRGRVVVKAVMPESPTKDLAERLFVAMYGVDTIIDCKIADVTSLYHLVRDRETEVIEAYRRGSDDMMRQWMQAHPPKAPSMVKRKYTKRAKK